MDSRTLILRAVAAGAQDRPRAFEELSQLAAKWLPEDGAPDLTAEEAASVLQLLAEVALESRREGVSLYSVLYTRDALANILAMLANSASQAQPLGGR